MITLDLKPRYEVVHISEPWSYKIFKLGQEIETVGGATDPLSIVGGEKTQRLMGWKLKQGLLQVEEELLKYGPTPVVMEPDTIKAILKAAWKRPKKTLDAAAVRGTLYHSYLEKKLADPLFELPTDFIPIYSLLQTKLVELSINLELPEIPVASLRHHFGGKIDAVGTRMGDLGIVDYKFSSGIYPEMALQVGGAYAQAFHETYGELPKWAAILRYDFSKADWECQIVRDIPIAIEGFLAAKKLKEILEQKLYA